MVTKHIPNALVEEGEFPLQQILPEGRFKPFFKTGHRFHTIISIWPVIRNMLSIEPIPAFRDNYIWVARNNQYAAAIDPGDASAVLDYLDGEKLELIAIFNTHHHSDHVDGNLELQTRFSCPIYGPENESIPGKTHSLAEGSRVDLPELGLKLDVFDIPGHTSGHIAYHGNDMLFCGDTLFGCGCGRVFEGTMAEMFASLERLSGLPEATLVYCAHEYTLCNIRFALDVEPGNPDLAARQAGATRLRNKDMPTLPSTIGLERKTNPFLRCAIPAVAAMAAKHAMAKLDSPLDVFTALRIWRNTF